MPPKGRKHVTTKQHQDVLLELKARKDEAKKMLADLRVSRKKEDKRYSRMMKTAKGLNPQHLLEIASVRGISPEELRKMADRMSTAKPAPASSHVDPPAERDEAADMEQVNHDEVPDPEQALVPLDVIPLEE